MLSLTFPLPSSLMTLRNLKWAPLLQGHQVIAFEDTLHIDHLENLHDLQ
jgi:hypothetical protein